MTKPRQPAAVENNIWEKLLAFVAGMFLLLCLAKFGNPIIFEERITPPQDILEFIYAVWPIHWGYVCLGVLVLAALPVANWRKRTIPRPIWLALVVWIVWQCIAATQTVDSKLTAATVRHFIACVVCFGVGYFALSETRSKTVWVLLLVGFLIMIKAGFEQHFGGLERTRKYFELYVAPTLKTVPTDYVNKISSNRIFGTMFYPNSLAAAILMTLPVCAIFVWLVTPRRVRWFAVGGLIAVSLATLFWSGSKAGWLLLLLVTAVWVLHIELPKKGKVIGLAILLVIGGAAFGLKYAGFFKKGATSVVARKDYWRAAMQVAMEKPVFGTGPGTFMVPYARLKAPSAEMTRLCHNDYLQQASDSGWIGFASYSFFVLGSIWLLYRERKASIAGPEGKFANFRLDFALWLGLLALALHSFVEFHLYVAGLAWVFFLLLGALWGLSAKRVDKPPTIAKVAPQ